MQDALAVNRDISTLSTNPQLTNSASHSFLECSCGVQRVTLVKYNGNFFSSIFSSSPPPPPRNHNIVCILLLLFHLAQVSRYTNYHIISQTTRMSLYMHKKLDTHYKNNTLCVHVNCQSFDKI